MFLHMPFLELNNDCSYNLSLTSLLGTKYVELTSGISTWKSQLDKIIYMASLNMLF